MAWHVHAFTLFSGHIIDDSRRTLGVLEMEDFGSRRSRWSRTAQTKKEAKFVVGGEASERMHTPNGF